VVRPQPPKPPRHPAQGPGAPVPGPFTFLELSLQSIKSASISSEQMFMELNTFVAMRGLFDLKQYLIGNNDPTRTLTN
jgi:hypothetical protein